jgi:DeoR/GlpR family transcriptional regulator of sugar metabolism
MSHIDTVYTVSELAAMWKVSDDTIRRIFAGENDVILISSVTAKRRKKQTIRIPAAVAERVWNRMRKT